MMADLPTHWPWPISIDRIYVGGAGREAEKPNRAAGNLHVDAFRLALEADGWLIEPEQDRLLCLPFSVVEGSFHLGPRGPVLLFHDDPRLADYVF